jgi:tetratricopeptide (TPR) repeat protein
VAAPRDEALAALADRGDAAARRRGVEQLAQVGTMADVPALVAALRDPDALVRALAEGALWEVWSRSGDAETDLLLAIGTEQMGVRQLGPAIATFTKVIDRRPDFAEGWNKRATAYYLAGDYARSLADCDEVIKRNPHHFGALSGYGMIYLELDQPGRALTYFERALAVNPNMRQVEATVEALRRLLLERRKDTI